MEGSFSISINFGRGGAVKLRGCMGITLETDWIPNFSSPFFWGGDAMLEGEIHTLL